MAYTRAEDVQIDAWQAIGNAGWTWNSLFPYYLKSENLTRPNQQQIEAGASYNPAVNGEEGHLHVGFKDYPVGDLTTYLNQTYQGLGIPWTEDVNGGKMRGFNIMPSTIDYAAQVREDAARAYYWPFKSRANLHVMLDTFVNRIVWDGKALDGQVTAQGVEVTSSNGTVSVIPAKREVIVSAGSLKSPGILELSGIGNPAILRKHNIPVQVDLPTVGENLQDQTNTDMGASGFRNITGANTLVYPNIYDIFGNETESLAQSLLHKLKQYASDAAKVSGGTMKEADLERLFQLQYNLIFKENVPIAEIIISPGGGKAVASEYWGLLPFSRGNVHISSSSPLDKPTINPNYFMFDYDMDIHVSIAKFIRRIFETEPMRGLIQEETAPGFSAVAQNSSDDAWKNWLLDGHYRSNFHPVGTAAMMPRSLGGVVNDQLTVYGTTNVRVIDASIVPFQVCGHLTSTLYAISERVAEIMKMEAAF
ncbi:hypothetical protein MAP00_008350 [Monascus purpureus]|nr:hypothetical protein MAP00_008350 [Monascus purpureus]